MREHFEWTECVELFWLWMSELVGIEPVNGTLKWVKNNAKNLHFKHVNTYFFFLLFSCNLTNCFNVSPRNGELWIRYFSLNAINKQTRRQVKQGPSGPGSERELSTGVQYLLYLPTVESVPLKQCYKEIWIVSGKRHMTELSGNLKLLTGLYRQTGWQTDWSI